MRHFLCIFIIISEVLLFNFTCSTAPRVRRENLKVRINATGDTIVLKFVKPHVDTKLEGYILGYGSNMFSKQFIKLPENGEPYETEIDAEPKYLIAVKSVKANEVKKQCTEKVSLEKPLHLVIGSVTPTSVLLSWGTLLKTPFTDINVDDCIDESQFTVRYRESEPSKHWNYQTCPTTSTVIDNLKPDTPYEFGVRAETDTIRGTWSPPVVHNTADIDVDKLLKPINQMRPQEPIIKAPQAFFPPIPVLHNITQSRGLPLRHTGPPPVPRRTLGTGSDDITSLPSEDPLLTQTLSFTFTPTSLPPFKTTSMVKPQQPTTSQLSNITQHHHYTTQTTASTTTPQPTSLPPHTTKSNIKPQLSTTEYQPSTTNTQPSTTETVPSTTKYQPSTPGTTEFHSTGQLQLSTTQPQTSTMPFQPSTIQQKNSTVQFHAGTALFKPEATPHKPSSIQSSTIRFTEAQSQFTTTHSQPSSIQPITTQSIVVTQPQPRTTQPENNTTQPKSSKAKFLIVTTHHKAITTLSTTHKPKISQSRKFKQNSSTAQPFIRTIPTQPNSIKPSQQNLYKTKQHPTIINIKSTHESNTYYQFSTTQNQQALSTNPLPTTLNKYHSFTNTPLTRPRLKESTQKNIASQHPTTQYPLFNTKDTPSPIRKNHSYTQSTTEIVTSSTIQIYSSTQHYSKTENSPISKPNVTNSLHSVTKHMANLPKQPFSSIKNVNQNSPWAEKQAETVNKKHPDSKPAPSESQDGQTLPKPALVREVTNRNEGRAILRNSSISTPVMRPVTRPIHPLMRNGTFRRRVPPVTNPSTMRVSHIYRNSTLNRAKGNRALKLPNIKPAHSGERHKGLLLPKPSKRPRKNLGSPANLRSSTPIQKRPNLIEKPIEKADKVGLNDLKQVEALPILKPQAAPATEKPIYQKLPPTTTPFFAFNGSRFDTGDNSSVFSSVPISDLDAMGKKRFVAPHVIYKTDKRPEEPCSVTHSMSYFPDEEGQDINVTSPPKNPPTNLTVVTVEGCPSFVILDWEKADNETTEYEVTSSTKGPKGREVSVLTTNQTHTAVENLKPESSYEFKVTPKNELGSGPPSDPVSFSTESADPRVSEIPTGKTAIWSSFPFKAGSNSECSGRMFVKRTWYRKFVGIQLCNSLRYKIYLGDSLKGKFYDIGDQTGYGEDHCQFVDSFLDGRTGGTLPPNQLPLKDGYFRAVRQEPVKFGKIGGSSHINYVAWYECGIPIPGSW